MSSFCVWPSLTLACTDRDGDGYSIEGGECGVVDCDDGDNTIHPGARDICDGIDNDCDGLTMKTDVDADGDGVLWCAGDCDDHDSQVYPGARERCNGKDDDCNGFLSFEERDSDGDGFPMCGDRPDCNDYDRDMSPGSQEICSDKKDNNCDGRTDEAGCVCVDRDNDGEKALFCGGSDCDDGNPQIHSGADEICTDGIDNDCDGKIDREDESAVRCPPCTDHDNDGYNVDGGTCGPIDCDDFDEKIHPTAPELCDGKDTDCDGQMLHTEVDKDGDGYLMCAGDCNDNDPSVFPGATEECDQKDNDCNGFLSPDERDFDNDGFLLCGTLPDCNDYDPEIHPEAPELCRDRKDNDCDGEVDEKDCVQKKGCLPGCLL